MKKQKLIELLRDHGVFIDIDQYQSDLMERNGLSYPCNYHRVGLFHYRGCCSLSIIS